MITEDSVCSGQTTRDLIAQLGRKKGTEQQKLYRTGCIKTKPQTRDFPLASRRCYDSLGERLRRRDDSLGGKVRKGDDGLGARFKWACILLICCCYFLI